MPNTEQDARIGLRIKALRESRRLTQEALAAEMGFNDRQTLAAIEAGSRRITASELVQAGRVLGVPVTTFDDPFQLVGEGSFSFRTKGASHEALSGFQEIAGRWVATYRTLGSLYGEGVGPLGKKLELSPQSSFEAASARADALWEEWQLGDVPSARLREAIEENVGVLVLYVDAPEGVSGAATHLPGYDTIIVNRRETPARQSYNLAHELFHILTWDAMPPAWDDPEAANRVKRVEYLAENFAATLLIPTPVLMARWGGRDEQDLPTWLNNTAADLGVSVESLSWRLVNAGLVTKAAREVLFAEARSRPTLSSTFRESAPLFSGRFVRLVSRAVEEGHLSLRRAAQLLGLGVAALGDLCQIHGYPLSYDLTD